MPTKQIYSVTTVATAAAETSIIQSTVPYVYDNPNPFVGAEHNGSGQGVTISGVIALSSTGTSTTALQVKCHQGAGLVGPVVGVLIPKPVAAGTADSITYHFVDGSRAPAAGMIYTISLTSTALTVAGNVSYATLDIEGA